MRVASFGALEVICSFMKVRCDVPEMSTVVSDNCAAGRRGKTVDNYETFVTDLSKVIGSSFPTRVEAYVGALLQLCSGTQLRTQAEAAMVLVQVVVNAQEPINDVNAVVRCMIDLCQSEHPTVRSRAVNVLGVLVGSV